MRALTKYSSTSLFSVSSINRPNINTIRQLINKQYNLYQISLFLFKIANTRSNTPSNYAVTTSYCSRLRHPVFTRRTRTLRRGTLPQREWNHSTRCSECRSADYPNPDAMQRKTACRVSNEINCNSNHRLRSHRSGLLSHPQHPGDHRRRVQCTRCSPICYGRTASFRSRWRMAAPTTHIGHRWGRACRFTDRWIWQTVRIPGSLLWSSPHARESVLRISVSWGVTSSMWYSHPTCPLFPNRTRPYSRNGLIGFFRSNAFRCRFY